MLHSLSVGAYLLAEEGASLGLILLLANLEVLFHGVVVLFGGIADYVDDHLRLELARQLQVQSQHFLPDLCLLRVGRHL